MKRIYRHLHIDIHVIKRFRSTCDDQGEGKNHSYVGVRKWAKSEIEFPCYYCSLVRLFQTSVIQAPSIENWPDGVVAG